MAACGKRTFNLIYVCKCVYVQWGEWGGGGKELESSCNPWPTGSNPADVSVFIIYPPYIR